MPYQAVDDILAVQMTVGATDSVGDVMAITGDLTCAKVAEAGSIKIVGTLRKHVKNEFGFSDNAAEALGTIETRFRCRRDDRVAGAAVAVGAIVLDANMKVINYSSASHDPAAIIGLAITHTTGADAAVQTLEY